MVSLTFRHFKSFQQITQALQKKLKKIKVLLFVSVSFFFPSAKAQNIQKKERKYIIAKLTEDN